MALSPDLSAESSASQPSGASQHLAQLRVNPQLWNDEANHWAPYIMPSSSQLSRAWRGAVLATQGQDVAVEAMGEENDYERQHQGRSMFDKSSFETMDTNTELMYVLNMMILGDKNGASERYQYLRGTDIFHGRTLIGRRDVWNQDSSPSGQHFVGEIGARVLSALIEFESGDTEIGRQHLNETLRRFGKMMKQDWNDSLFPIPISHFDRVVSLYARARMLQDDDPNRERELRRIKHDYDLMLNRLHNDKYALAGDYLATILVLTQLDPEKARSAFEEAKINGFGDRGGYDNKRGVWTSTVSWFGYALPTAYSIDQLVSVHIERNLESSQTS